MKIILIISGVIILILTTLLLVVEPASAPSNNELLEINNSTSPSNQSATTTATTSIGATEEASAQEPVGESKKDKESETSPVAKTCVVGGCSSQLCAEEGEEPLMTTCEFKEVYSCYKTSICTRQATGQCGWTDTMELRACVASSTNKSEF
jgi:eight-cysteine-cluster-containing protein